MRKTAVLTMALALCSTAGFAQLKGQAPKEQALVAAAQPTLESAKRIERTKAIDLVKHHKAVFVDVRPKESYDAGHIKGALSIPEADLMQRIKEIPPGEMIITYCA